MSSAAKTPALGLNQWEADDAPLRVDFNADNERVDTAYTGHSARLSHLASALEDTSYNVYQLQLQRYYEGKPAPRRATLFFDGFKDTGMMDAAATTVQLVETYLSASYQYEYALGNWDKRLAALLGVNEAYQGPGEDGFLGYGGSAANMRHSEVAQIYALAGAFRLARVDFTWRQTVQQVSQAELCAYAADGEDRPAALLQVLKTFPVSMGDNGSEAKTFTHSFEEPALLPAGSFALVFSAPAMSASAAGGRADFYRRFRLPQQNTPWVNVGGWRQMNSGGFALACNLFGGYAGDPPKYVSKEIALDRPCGEATVYLTQDSASAGQVVPCVALYDSGETPVYVPLTHDASRDRSVSAGRLETCWTKILPAAKIRARLKLQFDGLYPDSRVYEYGCILAG